MEFFDSVNLPAFRENAEGSVAPRWKKWLKQFELHLKVKNIEDPELKKAHLLYYGKEDIQKVLDQSDVAEDFVSDCYQRAVRLLNEYFLPKVSRIFERSVFRKMDRVCEEKIESFILRLKKQAEYCEFNDQTEFMIVDQLVEKMQENELKKKILRGNYNLEQIQQLISSDELVKKQLKSYDLNSVESNVNNVINKKVSSIECYSCGAKGHVSRDIKCPARDKSCGNCNQVGHFAKKCRKRSRIENGSFGFNRFKPGYQQFRASNNRHANTSNINNVYDEHAYEEIKDENLSEIVCNLNSGTEVDCTIGGVLMRFVLDTGAGENIIAEKEWKLSKGKFKIIQELIGTDRTFRAYGSKENLEVVGRVKMMIEANGVRDMSWFYIIKDGQRSLLCGKTAEKLQLIKIKKDVTFQKLRDVIAVIHIDPQISPVAQPYRRIPIAMESKVIEKLNQLLNQDIIEYVNEPSLWISPMVIVPKKDDIRICIDMRQANKAIMREKYPLPTFEELSQRLLNCKFFSKLDIQQAFHQLEIHESCRHITTFITPLGLMRYKRLLFGLSSAPETFQKTMEFITRNLKGVLVYIDDILVFGSNKEAHDKSLQELMERLKYYNVILNAEKCQFNIDNLDFLGFHITVNGIKISDEKVNTIKNFQNPANVDEIHSFLGLISYVSRYIPHLATIASPLNSLIRKNTIFKWSDHHQEAFDNIKNIISARESLALFDPGCETILFADASPVGLGAVLVQQQQQCYKICAYASKTLSDTEKRYAQIEKEALAIVWAVERFHYYLFGISFSIYTDHKPLTYIFNADSKPCLRVERWVLRLQSYNYIVKYVKGKNNIADPLSRLNNRDEKQNNFDDCETVIHAVFDDRHSLSIKEINNAMGNDTELQEVKDCIKSGIWPKHLIRYKLVAHELEISGDIILRNKRTVLPRKLHIMAIELAHEGHTGIVKMKKYLRELFWWPFMDKMIEEFVHDCMGCTLVSSADNFEPVSRTILPSRPWKYLAIDFLGPLPTKEYLLVVVDYYSRFIEVEIMTTITAQTTFKKLQCLFARHGYPEMIKADYGPQFRNEFELLCEKYDIKLIHSLPYAPHQNGEVERQNQGLLKSIKISQALGRDWKLDLQDYLLMYRSTPHMTTGKSPAELLFGRKIKTRFPIIIENKADDIEIRDKDNFNKGKGKEYADKKARFININVGDKVVVKNFVKKNKIDTNFSPEIHKVLERSGTRVKIENSDTGVINDRYIGHLKKVSTANPLIAIQDDSQNQNVKTAKSSIDQEKSIAIPERQHTPETMQINEQETKRSSRSRKQPKRYDDYEMNFIQHLEKKGEV